MAISIPKPTTDKSAGLYLLNHLDGRRSSSQPTSGTHSPIGRRAPSPKRSLLPSALWRQQRGPRRKADRTPAEAGMKLFLTPYAPKARPAVLVDEPLWA